MLVAFLVWDQAVAGSSPVTSTEKDKPLIHNELAVLFFVRLPVRENNVKRIMKRFVSKGFPGHPQPLLHRKQDWCHGV